MITRAEEAAWRSHPVTQAFFKNLDELQTFYTNKWSLSRLVNTRQTNEEMLKEACRDAGVVEALEIVLGAEIADEPRHIPGVTDAYND